MVSFFKTDYKTEFDTSLGTLKKKYITTPRITLELRITRDEQQYLPLVYSFFLLLLKHRSPSMSFTDKEYFCIFRIKVTKKEVLDILEMLKVDVCPNAEILSIKEYIIRNQNTYTSFSTVTKSSNTFFIPLIQFPLIKDNEQLWVLQNIKNDLMITITYRL